MKWSYHLCRVFGINVKLHVTFLILLAFILLAEGLASAVFLAIIFAFVVFHELGHSLVAIGHGLRVRSITLLPIGGVASIEDMPEEPWTEIKIALAGPAVNLAFAAILYPMALLYPSGLLRGMLTVNLLLAMFNLLPGFPMDGGRVLRAALALRKGMTEGTRIAARVGRWTALGIGLLGVLTGRTGLVLIAIFIYFAGKQEELFVRWRRAQREAAAWPRASLDPRADGDPYQAGGPRADPHFQVRIVYPADLFRALDRAGRGLADFYESEDRQTRHWRA